ncbi:MAG: glutamate--tRNA ligase [Betaproteobacteria bacterium]|nr:glutamate--tRNA ligase [Betaproteobacteria bacterium]
MVRTRFAPSPTGYLHIGGARTALFCWAYARRHGGTFILRIEDTDLERSTELSRQAILESMQWLGIDWDEGPHYQMQRLDRYREVAQRLLHERQAYYCYSSKEELDAMRDAQRARGEKPRYDRRWRDSTETPPAGVKPVIRFKTPRAGEVTFDDLVKGRIVVDNAELDDLVILRADGVPTYNFGVVVDDIDMNITHVIRGDDHVNNTPRQINIFRALGAELPAFAHVPMILGADGERLSKRHGAVSVTQYRDDGYLPEAMLNYLARLGWSHGDEEVFSMQQMVEWFDLAHISKSPARFNPEKLAWLNQQYLKVADDTRLAELARPFLQRIDCDPARGPDLVRVVTLIKERVSTLEELADAAAYFYKPLSAAESLRAQYYTADVREPLTNLRARLQTAPWTRQDINAQLKAVVAEHKLKLPRLAMPLRVMVTGGPQSPSIDAVLELLGRDEALHRIDAQLALFPE